MAPGIGEPGHAIPFALGLALAGRPVIAVTETERLLARMDILVLAEMRPSR